MRTPLVGWTFMARLAVALLCCAIAPAALAQVTPTINLSGLPSSTVPTRNLTLTANVSGSSGTPAGSVDFVEHNLSSNGRSTPCGNRTLDPSGNASCFYTTPPNGNYEIEVVYSGDGVYAATTTAFPFTTAQATVTITLSGLLSTVPGRNLTLTSNVSSASPLGTPTGSVDFVEHNLSSNGRSTPCGNRTLDPSGNASCFYTTPPNGNYEIEVVYSGDGPNAPATQAFPFTTQQATVSITLSGLPSSTRPVTSLTITSNVSSASPLGTPTGSVDFVRHDLSSNGRTGLCGNINVDPSGNSSCFFTTPVTLGNYEIEVNYSGDAANAARTGVFPFTVSNSPVVTNNTDSDPGSLRDAINFANANCSGQTITFNIPGTGVQTIQPTSALPVIICSHLVIDGYSQPGARRNRLTIGNDAIILIELNGANAGPVHGLEHNTDNVVVTGLAINGFASGRGISIAAPINTIGMFVSGNFIGTDASGTIAKPNAVGIGNNAGATGLGIGSQDPGDRNVISGNSGIGIELLSGDSTFIGGNYIGTDASGTAALPNGSNGISAKNTTNTDISGNTVSGNLGAGIGIVLSSSVFIKSNLIGTNATGNAPLPNAHGITTTNSSSIAIGGAAPGEGNVIAGNTGFGVHLFGTSPGNTIWGNFIGTDSSGASSLGNGSDGVFVDASSSAEVGCTIPGSANIIAHNSGHGVTILGGLSAIEGNSIFGNVGLGINLNTGGTVAANDTCDVDSGGNGFQNYPVLTAATSILDGGTRIVGNLNSAPSTAFRIEFFSNLATDNAGNRAGRNFLGSMDVTTDAACNAPIDIGIFSPVNIGDVITATATDPSGNTGWFSGGVVKAAAPPVAPTISAIRPASGGSAGGSAVVIEGTDLDTVTSVTFGGNAAAIVFPSAGALTVSAPAHLAGAVDVVVTNGGGSATSAGAFSYVDNDDAARDFSVASNPSPRWTYGYEPSTYGTFTPFSTHFRSGSADIWWFGAEPTVLHNWSGSAYSPACCNPVPAGGLLMHPGPFGEKSVIRWTAPSSGTYHVAGAFTGLDLGGTTTDVAVMRNNNAAAKLFSANVFDTGVAHSFALDIALNPGETLEFAVGFGNGSYSSDSTGLDVTITRTGNRPNSAVSLSTTSLSFGAELVDVFSPTQRVTLTNTGTDPLAISSILTTSSFSMSRSCGSSLAPGASCFMDVSFVPTTNTPFSGTVTINTDAPTSPDVVTLSGTGMLPPTFGIATFTSVVAGGVSTIGLTISNPVSNPLAFSSAGALIQYPAGWTNDPARAIQSSCGALVGGSPGGNAISATNGSAAPGVSCHLVNAQILAPATPGTYTFTILPGNISVSSPVGYSSSSPITVTVTVTATAPPPALSLSPTSLAFGTQTVNTTSATRAVQLTNTGGTAMNITSITVGSGFTKSNGSPACGTTLVAGASCIINVAFAPTSATTYNASLTIVDSASGSPHTVTLTGTGVPQAPALGITPTSLTFSARTVGTTSTAQTVTLMNNGPGTLAIASMTISGDFAFTSACPATVASGATCTFDVTFTPVVAGGRIGSVTITSNASGSPHSVPLSGTGQSAAVGVLEVTPSPLQFDPQALGTTSAPQLLVLHNAGTATVNRGPESVDGDFRLLTGTEADAATQNQTCGAAIAPGDSCNLALVFTPTAIGTRSGAIALPNDTAAPVVTVRLLGTGATATAPRVLSVQPQLLTFGNQAVGTRSAGKTATLTNNSSSTAAITDLATSPRDFIVSDSCATIASHASCSPLVTFQPTAVGPRTGTLTIRTFSETDPYVVQLTGTGVFNGVPALEVSVTRIGFGNVLLGGSTTLGFTLTNIGLVPVVLGAMNVLDDFTLASACGTTLDVGASCSVQIVFFPHVLGVHAATLDIFSNAANSPHHVDLSGTGCAIPTPTRARVRPVLCGP